MEHTATQSNIQDALKEKDNSGLEYKIQEIGESIFKTAENEKEVIFLMGNNIINRIEKEEYSKYEKWAEKRKIKRELNKLQTKLLIPIIAAMIETVLNERRKKGNKE
nr:MAG: hypothetical protein [Microviridae sp.]